MAADPTSVAVVDWTILPAKVTAKAWIDAAFRIELLENPDEILRREVRQWTSDLSFVVHADTQEQRHLPLPRYKEEFGDWGEERLAAVIAEETEEDDSLAYQLPPRVILRALTDETYRGRLLQDANAALGDEGISPEAPYKVHENTAETYHLALPMSPTGVADLDFEALRDHLLEEFGVTSTKCCATGTCT